MKMKKLITLLLALAMVLSLAACGSKDTPAPDGQNTPAATYKIKLGTTGNEEHQSTPTQPSLRRGASPSASSAASRPLPRASTSSRRLSPSGRQTR